MEFVHPDDKVTNRGRRMEYKAEAKEMGEGRKERGRRTDGREDNVDEHTSELDAGTCMHTHTVQAATTHTVVHQLPIFSDFRFICSIRLG